MASGWGRTETRQGTVTGDTDPGQALQCSLDERDRCLARERYPRLYWQITNEHVSFDHIAKAWRISHPVNLVKKEEQSEKQIKEQQRRERRASRFLECLAREKFSKEHRDIEKDYWQENPWAGCALTADGRVHSAMNIADPELVLYEEAVHQLCRNARRTFETAAGQSKEAAPRWRKQAADRRREKAERDLKEVGEMLYTVLTRVIFAASVLEKKHATQRERDEAFAAVRAQWQTVRASVEEMIQRQARFEYFQGVGLGALLTIPALAIAGWAAIHYGMNQLNEPGKPGSLTAAIIGGAAGAVISVTQRMLAKNSSLELDFTAPKTQKIVLGALRPVVGAVFGAVVYFALIGGLLAVHAQDGKNSSVALAFFAVAGFAAGFSERFATDVLERASSGILPAAGGRQDAAKPDELSVLLSEQRHHAETPGHQSKVPGEPPR